VVGGRPRLLVVAVAGPPCRTGASSSGSAGCRHVCTRVRHSGERRHLVMMVSLRYFCWYVRR
jgi:hypothetical protein